ncbi:TIGR04255 family protein [Cryobacterium algoritolerans]|uniref:TIGR04255 family protein n=1 Tax=Cryobacterium algoritolerans TaxID=1259184 RepID=UPI00141B21F9|nr:TIGR04255 family protein [Cryobacterium algoritolerans]
MFEQAPLTLVLCQVRFPPILALLSAAGVTGFQTALRDVYPVFLEPEHSASINLSPGSIGVDAHAPVWKLRDEKQNWTVGIAIDFVSLETDSYTSMEEFLSRFDHVLKALRRTLRPAESLRVGLRKVNVLKSKTANQTFGLVGMVRRELLGPLAVAEFPAPISGAASHLQFQDDDSSLVVRSGLSRDDSGALVFVIDMDYFTERPYEIDGGNSLTMLMTHFSEGATSFFHWAIDDDYKATLKPHPRDKRDAT